MKLLAWLICQFKETNENRIYDDHIKWRRMRNAIILIILLNSSCADARIQYVAHNQKVLIDTVPAKYYYMDSFSRGKYVIYILPLEADTPVIGLIVFKDSLYEVQDSAFIFDSLRVIKTLVKTNQKFQAKLEYCDGVKLKYEALVHVVLLSGEPKTNPNHDDRLKRATELFQELQEKYP